MRAINDQKFSDYLRFSNVISNFENWYRTGITMRELSKLNDFHVADIRVMREGIATAANDSVAKQIDRSNANA